LLAEGLGLYCEHGPDSHLTRRKVVKLAAYPLWQNNLIFPTITGTTTSATNLLGRHFKPLLNNAALPRIRFHELRHTCATIPLMAGKRPKYVHKHSGNASISTTLDTYFHLIEGTDGGLADAMDDAL
jgi:integrase